MKNSGGKTKTVYKLNKRNAVLTCLIFLGVFMITLGGLLTTKSSLVDMLKYKASGDVPSHSKEIIDNQDGTWKLSLDIVGEAEKKAQKANVLIIFDTSSSMNQNTGNTETTYTPTSSTSTGLYGLIDGEYVPLTRTSTTSGPWWNQTTTYHFWYDGVEYTGQRYNQQVGNQTRIMAAKSAITNLADSLMSHNGVDGNADDTIEMAIVDFANMASTIQTPTNDKQTMLNAISSLSAGTGTSGRGTNWEAGLRHATNSNNINFNDSDPTYVIFVSDGNPTFYLENPNGSTTNDNNREGSGSETNPANNVQLSYNAALPAAQALTAKYGKDTFYTIGAYGNVTRMEGLTTGAGAPAGNYYAASNTAALQEALNDILEKIEMSGISKAKIEDGTTEAVKIESTDTNGMLVVDTNSFEYTITIPITEGKASIKGQEATLTGNTLTWGDNKSVTGTIDEDGNFVYKWIGENPLTDVAPNPAQDVNGKVTWDLSNAGVLINGAKYSVTFDVWPSQETYDLIADLKNGTKKYSNLDPSITKYLSDTYELKTNTNAKITYTDTRNDAGEQESGYTNPDPVATNSSSISIKKEWDNELDARTDRPVTVSLNRDGSNFITVNLDGTPDDEWETAAWEATGINIATGLARLSDDGELEVLDVGHDYKFSELGSEAFNWELETETVHPMLINGSLKKLLLVEDESEIPSQLNEKDYYNGYYRLANGKVYKDAGTNPQIKAINHRRSNFNLKKVVNGENANPNSEFEFTIRVTQKDEKDKVIADDSTTNDDDLWFSVQDKDGNWVDFGASIGEWTRYTGTDNQTGKTTYYYYAPNNTQLVIKLKADYNLRFTNLISNTDISVVEGNTTNYSLEEITVIEGFDTENDNQTISGKTFTGHIGENNASYQVQYKNKNDVPETTEATVKKVWDDAENQDGKRPETLTVTLSDGQTATLSESNNWEATISGLPKYKNGKEVEYTWTEGTLPEGYEMTLNKTEGKITTIKNSYTPEETEVTVVKAWNDDKDRDRIRPTSIKVTLTSSDPNFKAREVTLEKDKWSETISGLPKYENGHLAVYTWTEDETGLPAGYSLTGNSTSGTVTTLTNSYTPKTTEATVKKVWDDSNNQDGKRPTSISVQLKANGVAAQQGGKDVVATLTEANGWNATVSGLPLNENGTPIDYTWTEDETGLPEGYSLTDTSKEGTVTTLTNSYTPEKDKITVTKIWDDASDQDGKRPDDVAFTVTGSDGKTYDATLSGEGDTWTQEVEVDKFYNGGQAVTFTVDEEEVADYQKSIDNSKLTITNSYTPEKDKITVTKIWDDASDQDGKRPDDVAFTVTGSDGKTYDATLSGDEDTWTQEVEVDKFYNGGQAVTFTVDEEEVADYQKSIDNSKLTITNSYTPDTTEATIIKVWEDVNDQDGKRPETLPVSLSNGVSAVDYSLEPNEKGEWTLTVSNLPKYRNGGEEITYTWTESEKALPEGYKLTDTSKEGTVTTLTNSYTPEKDTITVTKIWDDASDSDGKRPDDVTFTVTGSDGKTYDATLSGDEDTWTQEVEVDKYYNGGQAVTFTVDEEEVADYEKSIDNSKLTITNSYTPDTTEATIIKVWEDVNDQDGKRPETLPVSLSNGVSAVDYSLEPNEKGEWTLTVSNLPKYRNGGEEITYTWTESEKALPEGYKLTDTSKEGTVTTLTNSYTPEKDTITVTKIWDDASDQDGKRPDDVAFTVTGSDGKTYDATLSGEGDTWTQEVEVDKFYNGGQAVTFTVDEEEVADYQKSIDNSKLTITNSYTPEKDKITVTKIWDDASDQDGKRPDDVAFTVTGSDGKTYDATLSGDEDTWTQEVEVDKFYNGGQAVTFTVDEEEVADYQKSIDNSKLTITNSYTPETTEATIKKVWEDDGDRDGKQPKTLKMTLNDADNTEVTLDENNSWSATVSGLPKYANGQEIDYRWTEEEIAEYTIKSNGKEGLVQTITNHYDPEKTYVCVKKVWNDDENRDDIRPGSLTVVLSDGTEVVLNEQNGWAGRVDNLFKYHNHGELINYTWSEKDLPEGYELTDSTPTDDKDDKTGLTGVITTLTNTHEIATTEATVKKVWNDADDQDGKRPATLSVQLLGDKKPVKKDGKEVVVTLSESTGWSATVEDLPLNDKGNAIDYTWSEVDLPDTYELTDTSKEGTVTTLTNTHTPEKIDIPVKKEWVNNDPYEFGNPASVVVNLVDNGKVVRTTTLSAGNNWTDTFTGLDKYRGGQEIPYEVKEEAVLDYDTKIEGSIAEGFTVINTYNPTLIPIEVTKTWDDANDQDGVRPRSIQMTLIGKVNGEVKYTSETETVTDADYQNNNTWKHTFTGLPKRYLGQEIEYSVVEALENGSPYTGESVTDLEIKNSYEPQTITFNIFKDWDDNDNNDGKRPESITVHLLKDGTEIDSSTITEKDGWAISFGPLAKFRDHGVEIDYTVVEDPVKYYENTNTSYTKDLENQSTDAIVVNTHENEKAKIEITKIWKDDNNKYNYRPNSIEVEIYADGELAKTVTLNASNNWKIVVTDLDKYAAGKEIEYTIKEKAVAHYTTAIAGTAEDGFTITNTVENPPEITPPNTSIEGIGEAATDKYLALLMTILAMFASAGIRRVFE